MSPAITIPRTEPRGLTVAVSTTLDRLGELKPYEYEAVLKLLHLRRETPELEERIAIDKAIQEVMSCEPMQVYRLDEIFPPGPMHPMVKARAERIGGELRKLRTAAGLSTAQLAERSTIPEDYIVRLENAEESPSRIAIKRLAAGLNVGLTQLDPTAIESDDDKD